MMIILNYMSLNKIIHNNFQKEKTDMIKLFSFIDFENIENFKKLVSLSLKRIKKKIKYYFMVMEAVQQMLNI
jgi:hypothetical protein